MLNYLLVFIGGGLGSMCRYGIAHWMTAHKLDFPWATLIANALACVVLGILLGLQIKNSVSDTHKFLLMTGFCGGFSTFSTFSAETFQLIQAQQTGAALANVGLSLFICLVCIFLGTKICI